jgi:hypothetical protein
MRAHDVERDGSTSTPRIAASRADAVAPRGQRSPWDALVVTAVPAAAPDPAEIRALAFAASIGPVRAPRSAPDGDDVVIDLAGEEALIEYLSRVAPVSID